MDTQTLIKLIEQERQDRLRIQSELDETKDLLKIYMTQFNLMVRDREYSDPRAA